jgi:predicted enzyme related to lactoylglutathione lyase
VARLVGNNHVAVEVDSIDAALEFFGRIFELELRGRIAGMTFIDMGDQFIALSEGRTQPPDRHGHVGVVVDDADAALEAARAAGAEMLRGHDFRVPWGNHWQVVDYRDIQFTKTDRVLEGMGLTGLAKTEKALGELRAKGLAD